MVKAKFKMGDKVQKKKGSSWHGKVVGFYSSSLTEVGYVVESLREPGSCQLYPEEALELATLTKCSEEFRAIDSYVKGYITRGQLTYYLTNVCKLK